MQKKHYAIYAAVTIGAAAAISLVVFWLAKGPPAPVIQPESGTVRPAEKVTVHLYFADRQRPFLRAEKRTFFRSKSDETFGKGIIQALIRGSEERLIPTLAPETTLRAFYLAGNNTAYVDLDSAVRDHHPGGVTSEILTIYSIVNSLVLNMEQVKQVKIMIDGKESPTLAGHIDLQFPIKANMLLVR